ncbi:LicD family protein [Segatella copri]|uniref:LicD family protein n=1 Tax=Segatella copri TaxID=165179 RepID=UPI003F8BBAB4
MGKSAKEIMNNLALKTNCLMEVDQDMRNHLQDVLVEMMQDIHNVCIKRKIGYALVGGSCLGAVRHQGFIPWDDDIDISMLREDWEKFRSCFDEELGEKYVMEAPQYGNKDCKTTWAKVYKKKTVLQEIMDVNTPYEQGIFIDIFFYENVSNNKIIRKIDACLSDFLKGVATSMVFYKYPNELMKQYYGATPQTKRYYNMRRFLGFLFSWMSHKRFCDCYDKFVSRHKTPSEYITAPTGRKNYMGEILQRKWWIPQKQVKFENTEFLVPADSHNYLLTLFGKNYMQLPPVEKREKHFIVKLKF